MIKTLSLAIFTILFTGAIAIADTSKNTANYFRGLAPEYIGKKVSLDVASVSALHKVDSEKYGFLIAHSFDDKTRKDGGKILVVSDREELLALVKKFGSSPDVVRGRLGVARDVDTRRLTGVLRQAENKVLYIDLAENEIPANELLVIKKAMAALLKKAPTGVKGKGKARILRKGK